MNAASPMRANSAAWWWTRRLREKTRVNVLDDPLAEDGQQDDGGGQRVEPQRAVDCAGDLRGEQAEVRPPATRRIAHGAQLRLMNHGPVSAQS